MFTLLEFCLSLLGRVCLKSCDGSFILKIIGLLGFLERKEMIVVSLYLIAMILIDCMGCMRLLINIRLLFSGIRFVDERSLLNFNLGSLSL